MALRDNSSEGSLVTMLQLPWPWPVTEAYKFLERKLNGSTLSVECTPDAALKASLIDLRGELPAMEITSCPIHLEEPAFVMLGIAWNRPGDFRIHIDGATVASFGPENTLPESYHVPKRRDRAEVEREDFSRDSATVRISRKGTFHGYQPKLSHTPGTPETLAKALEEQTAEVSDLLELIEKGSTHHTPGLANSVAKFIADGDPLPTLQLFAASNDLPLIMHTSARPSIEIPSQPDLHLVMDFSAEATPIYDNPVDLDVWLELGGASLEGRQFSHRRTMRQIRNVIGSHSNYDVDPLIEFLRSTHSAAVGGTENDLLVQYVTKMGHLAVELSQKVGRES